jgi:hypothetical protein
MSFVFPRREMRSISRHLPTDLQAIFRHDFLRSVTTREMGEMISTPMGPNRKKAEGVQRTIFFWAGGWR